jgi:hypothetical protein
MSWAEVKMALNSSLGTENFKPLDKMLEEIYNNYHIVESNLQIGEFEKEYTVKYNGRIRIYATVRNLTNFTATHRINLTINGIEQTLSIKVYKGETQTQTFGIDVIKGDEIKVEDDETSPLTLESGYIGGAVVQGDIAIVPTPFE